MTSTFPPRIAAASPTRTAVLLVAHGSRSPRARADLAQLAAQVRQHWPASGTAPWIETACLEFAPQPLHAQIAAIATSAQQAGCARLAILPLFLQPGVHACEDIPAEIAQAQAKAPLSLQLLPYLGAQPAFTASLRACLAATPATGRILLAHGSRRPGSEQPLANLAAQIDAVLAFWSVPPALETQIDQCYARGQRRLTIQPYFLFAGRLTAAIAAEVARLQARYPDLLLHLQPPLSASGELASAIATLLAAAAEPD